MTAMRYQVRVAGRMSERACAAFPGTTMVPVAPETMIYGEFRDDAELHGLLELCLSLGLRVVRVQEAPSGVVARSGARSAGHGSGGRVPAGWEEFALVRGEDRGAAAAHP